MNVSFSRHCANRYRLVPRLWGIILTLTNISDAGALAIVVGLDRRDAIRIEHCNIK